MPVVKAPASIRFYFGVLFIIKTHGPLPLAGDRSGALVPRLTEGVLSVW
jgi:hypothetical protein